MKTAKALWHLSPTESAILPAQYTQNSEATLQLTTQYSLLSSGTEKLVATGQVPSEIAAAMQVPFQEGTFDFPIKYGYSLVAKVENENHPWQNRLVHLLHPHQDYLEVTASDVFLIPEGIPALRATLASNLETALNAVWEAPVGIGDRVLVAGFGIIGSLLARLIAAIPAVDLWVLEKDAQRCQQAKASGFKIHSPDSSTGDFDLAFNTTANEAALQYGIDQLGFEGKLIELSWYGKKKISLQLGGSFHQQRKQIISSQVANLPQSHQSRWDYQRRKTTVFDLLKNPTYDQHIQQVIPFEEAPKIFDSLRQNQIPPSGICLSYSHSST